LLSRNPAMGYIKSVGILVKKSLPVLPGDWRFSSGLARVCGLFEPDEKESWRLLCFFKLVTETAFSVVVAWSRFLFCACGFFEPDEEESWCLLCCFELVAATSFSVFVTWSSFLFCIFVIIQKKKRFTPPAFWCHVSHSTRHPNKTEILSWIFADKNTWKSMQSIDLLLFSIFPWLAGCAQTSVRSALGFNKIGPDNQIKNI